MELAFTPSKTCSNQNCDANNNNNNNENHTCPGICSICLSPLKTPSGSITTRCNHDFHYLCLQEAKFVKSECPLCRSELTPPIGTNSPITIMQNYIPRIQRQCIVERSRNARQAVAASLLRQQMQREINRHEVNSLIEANEQAILMPQ